MTAKPESGLEVEPEVSTPSKDVKASDPVDQLLALLEERRSKIRLTHLLRILRRLQVRTVIYLLGLAAAIFAAGTRFAPERSVAERVKPGDVEVAEVFAQAGAVARASSPDWLSLSYDNLEEMCRDCPIHIVESELFDAATTDFELTVINDRGTSFRGLGFRIHQEGEQPLYAEILRLGELKDELQIAVPACARGDRLLFMLAMTKTDTDLPIDPEKLKSMWELTVR